MLVQRKIIYFASFLYVYTKREDHPQIFFKQDCHNSRKSIGVEIQNLFDYLIKKYQFLTILQLADFEHHVVRRGLCPLDRFCSKDSDCVDLHDINCLCYVGYYGGCFCSLAGQCVITD